MDTSNPQSTARIAGHPVHPMLIPFPIAFFVGTLAVDIAYRQTGDPFWATASRWLLIAGLAMAALAALAGLTDFLGDRRIRALSAAWHHHDWQRNCGAPRSIQSVAAAPTGRCFCRADRPDPVGGRDVVALTNGWRGWEMVYRGRVGVADR